VLAIGLCGAVPFLVRFPPAAAQDASSELLQRVVKFVVTPRTKTVALHFAALPSRRERTAPSSGDAPAAFGGAPVSVYRDDWYPNDWAATRAENGTPRAIVTGYTDDSGTYVVDARLLAPATYIAVAGLNRDDFATWTGLLDPRLLLGNAQITEAGADEGVPKEPDKDQAIERIYYATDRDREDVAGEVRYGAGRSPSDALQFGACDVSIPRDHRMAAFESASVLRFEFSQQRGRDITLLKVRPETRDAFVADISAAVRRSERHDVLVFIHGFNTTFADAARRTAQLRYDLSFDGPAILYSWPSQGSAPALIPNPLAYGHDANAAKWSTPHLMAMLADVVRRTGARRVHVIAHSMGNQPLTDALVALANRGAKRIFDDVVLAAPDIDRGVFAHIAYTVASMSNETTIYVSSHDKALEISSALGGYARTGLMPVYDDRPSVRNMVTVDATAVDSSFDGHSYFGSDRSVVTDLFYLLRGFPPPRAGMVKVGEGLFRLQ
jgi:esterase/lipase superfamily enzyme